MIINVLAIGCHPDDLEIACFGTLARCVKRGDVVTICHVANGSRGHVVIKPDALRLIRLEEARQAGAMIGAAVVTLDVPDLVVNSDDPEQTRVMINVIRTAQPDLIITHSPRDYMKDHQEVQKLVFDASFSASIPSLQTGVPGVAAITPLFKEKLAALDTHHSQTDWMREHDHIDFLEFVRTCSRFRGLQCGVQYAEGYQLCQTWPRIPTMRLLP